MVNNAAGNGAGTIDDNGSTLIFDNTQTFNNATINLAGALYEDDTTGAGTVLTLGSGVAIDESGDAYIYTGGNSGDGIVNQGAIKQSGTSSYLYIYGDGSLTNSGTITAASSGGALIIDTTTFTNSGTIDVANGDTVTIESTTFTNLPAYTLTAGTYEAEAGSTLEVDGDDTITTDDADIILSGAGSTIETYNSGTGVTNTIDTTLCTIGASGELQLLASRNWTTAGAAITNDGLIQLGGGTLISTASGASLTDAAGSKLRGFGTVTATTFTNSGTIEASGGTLTLTDAVSGTGGLQIDAGANLVLAATAATTNAATFNGQGATLTLDHVGSLTGVIGGVGLEDTFDLVGVTANGATVNGSNQLVVTDNGTTVDTLQLSGNNSGFSFLPVAVSGGTDIVSLPRPIPATVADYLDVQSLYDQIPGGFAISDTAANVSASLGQLNDSHITSITATGGPVAVTVSTFSADQSTLDKIVGGFDVSDTATNISADLNALDDGNINSITISDNGDVGASAAQLTSNSTAISKLVNANGTPYQLAIAETAANIEAGVATLEADGDIASITATGGPVVVSVSTFSSDQSALNTIVGGFDVSDTATNISASLNALDDANINSITISDNGDVGASVAQLTSDATTIGKLVSANATPCQLAITDTATNVLSGLATVEADVAHIASIAASGGPVVVTVSTFSADQAALDKIVGGFAISDTAANISANHNSLNDPQINSITISNNGAIGAPIATNGVTTLVQVDGHYELEAMSSGTGPLIELNGGAVTATQFPAGWTPVGAKETGDGYEVAWSVPGKNEYEVWNTDGNGDYTSVASGILSGASATLEAVEANFGDGTFPGAGPPASTTQIGTNGQLDEVGNLFELNPAGGGPLLELEGSVVTSTQFPAHWTPVGAVQTGNGYEVAFGNGANEYVVWNTDTNGDYTSAATGILSGTSYALEELGVTFGENLNGDGTVEPTMPTIATNSTTTLTEVANQFELNPVGGGTGPFLELNGSAVTNTQFPAGWTPVGAVRTATGYEVAFGTGSNEYEVWNTDSNGNFTSAATGILTGTSPTLEGVEANFDETSPSETFPGAGSPATPTTIATNGTTTLAEAEVGGVPHVGDVFELNPAGGGTGPLLELNGSVVTTGQFPADWTPVGAKETPTGYEVAFGAPVPGQSSQNQYVVWNTDSNGDYTSAATGILSGTSPALEAMEADFGETFPGAGPPASPGTPASTTVTGTNAATTLEIGSTVSKNQTIDFADLPSGGPSAVDLIDPNGFLGKIENFASPDTVNLSGDWVFLRFSENPAATLGTLTLHNVTSHADLSLKFVGDYAPSNFAITPGMTTTTIAHT